MINRRGFFKALAGAAAVAFTHTVEKMPDLVGKSLDKLFEAWAARKEK